MDTRDPILSTFKNWAKPLGVLGYILLAVSAGLALFGVTDSIVFVLLAASVHLVMWAFFTRVNQNITAVRHEQRKILKSSANRIETELSKITDSLEKSSVRIDEAERNLVKSIGVTNRSVSSIKSDVGAQLSKGDLEQLADATFRLALSQRRIENELNSKLIGLEQAHN